MKTFRVLVLMIVATMTVAEHAHAQELDGVMQQIAGAWTRNDEKSLSRLVARAGASIETDAGRLGPLGSRQAAAILRILFDERATQDVRTRQAQAVGGTPQKAYAELVWTTMAPETTQPVRVVVFVELVLEQDRYWRITKIRLLP